MQEWLSLTIPPIVGAIVGVATNDLAVRMLFRPLRPWYIGRWKIPFTPGLIPAEQERLADQMAATLVKNLLTPDDLQQLLGTLLTPERLEFLLAQAIEKLTAQWDIPAQREKWIAQASATIVPLLHIHMPTLAERLTENTLTPPVLEQLLTRLIDNMLPQLHLTPATAYFVTRQIMEHLLTPEHLRLVLLELLQPNQIEALSEFARARAGGRYGVLLSLLNLKDLLNKSQAFLQDETEQAHSLLAELLMLARVEDTLYRQILHLKPDQWQLADQQELKQHLATGLFNYLQQHQHSFTQLWQNFDLEPLVQHCLKHLEIKDFPGVKDQLPRYLAQATEHFIKNQGEQNFKQLLRQLPLENLIASKIKLFSPADLEALILEVSRKELQLIVILGGLLGFFIGLLQVGLMQLIN